MCIFAFRCRCHLEASFSLYRWNMLLNFALLRSVVDWDVFLRAVMWSPACTYRRQVQKSLGRRKCSIACVVRRNPCTPLKTRLIFNPYKVRELKNGEASSKAPRSIFGPWPPTTGGSRQFFTRRRWQPHAQPPTWRPGYTYLKWDVGGKVKSVRQYTRTRLQENGTGNLECTDKEGVE